jgi:hypothetical protein
MGVVGVLYLVPSFVAVVRQRPNMHTIFGVNLLLGWTVIGWIAALLWALAGREHDRGRPSLWSTSGRKPCPSCGHSLHKNARRCRYCGYTITAKNT